MFEVYRDARWGYASLKLTTKPRRKPPMKGTYIETMNTASSFCWTLAQETGRRFEGVSASWFRSSKPVSTPSIRINPNTLRAMKKTPKRAAITLFNLRAAKPTTSQPTNPCPRRKSTGFQNSSNKPFLDLIRLILRKRFPDIDLKSFCMNERTPPLSFRLTKPPRYACGLFLHYLSAILHLELGPCS